MPYQHILFDVDGTLYDTYFANMDALSAVIKRRFPEREFAEADFERIFGLPCREGLTELGFSSEEIDEILPEWLSGTLERAGSVKLYPHITALLSYLKEQGYQLCVVTSRRRRGGIDGVLGDCLPLDVRPYITRAVCSDDVKLPKPAPDSLLHYMQLTGAKPEDILYVGDAATDLQCADAAGVDFALALWGSHERRHLKCRHYLRTPFDLINVLTAAPADAQWFNWAREIQAIGQIGLNYCHDVYDEERWTRLREIAAEILASHTHASRQELNESFLFDKGYITPKVDTRAVIFNDKGEILLVQEKSGLWNLPGGWCEENLSAAQNAVKEVREEAGLNCHVERLIALMDRNAHNTPKLPFGALKVFVLCRAEESPDPFRPNSETLARGYFAQDKLPLSKLRLDTNTYEQLMMCFAAKDDPHWQAVIE